MKKFFSKFKILILVGFLVIIGTNFSVSHVKADTISDKKREIEELQRQINENRTNLSQKSKEVNNLKNQIDIMTAQIKDTELQISYTQANIDKVQAEIDILVDQIEQKEEELKVQKENLYETMRVMYESPQDSTVEIIIGSNSLSELVDRAQYIEALEYQIEITINKIMQIKADLETKRNEQEKKRQELTDLLRQHQDYLNGLSVQKTAKDDLLSKTKGEEASYQQLLAQKYAEWERANAELRQMEGGTIGVAGSYPVANWPMYGWISVPFGACGCGAYFCNRCHTGIDIVAPALSGIKAAHDGTVIDVNNICEDFGNWSCGGGYGNYVKVQHDDGYTARYGHMSNGSVRVSVGQRVQAGLTVLGLEGSSGFSTGYHLHFEIRNPSNIPVGAALP